MVMRYDGTTVRVEDIKVGDKLMGPDSQPRNVLGITSGVGPLFRIVQKTGENYIVNNNHILALTRSSSAKNDKGELSKAGNYQRPNGRYARYERKDGVSTISAAEYAGKSNRFKCNFFGFKVKVEFEKKQNDIDPYFLGLWIGDGDKDRVAITNMDTEVLEFSREYALSMGWSVREFDKPGQQASHLLFSNKWKRDKNSPFELFRSVGATNGEKKIPESYILTSEEDRLRLLAGIVDTDGHVANGVVYVTQKSERLAKDIKRLADTLGFKTSKRDKIVKFNGQDYTAFVVSIGGDVERIPCLIGRKRSALITKKNKDWRRTRVDAIPIEDGEYFGFELDGDHLFLLADGTVTHNSHFFAELLIEENIREKLDCVCLRETLKSLEFSVKKLLESKIEKMNAGAYFEVQDRRILTKRGGVIIFEGMQNHTADSIKSLEGFDRAWFEEAQAASQKSLDLLRPTIRKAWSEMWFSWNPEKQEDPIDQLLRGPRLPPDAIVVEANYHDNPWLPDELRMELEYDRARDPDKFAHVWLGQYRQHSEARVFKNWRVEEFTRPQGTIFRFGADWGFSVDPSVLVRASTEGNILYIDYEAYLVGCEIIQLPDLFDTVPESRKWIITADNARPETISHLRAHGYPKIMPSVKGVGSLQEGIEFLQAFDIVVHPRCKHTIDELKNYRYKTDPLTDVVTGILEDKNNHVIDALRYALEGARKAGKARPRRSAPPPPNWRAF